MSVEDKARRFVRTCDDVRTIGIIQGLLTRLAKLRSELKQLKDQK